MTRRALRRWVVYGNDMLLLLSGTILALSSLLVWVVLPKGYHPAWLLWIEIHTWSGLSVTVLALLHVALHLRWLMQMTRRLLGRDGEAAAIRSRHPDRSPMDPRS